jgi:hypothetical protein
VDHWAIISDEWFNTIEGLWQIEYLTKQNKKNWLWHENSGHLIADPATIHLIAVAGSGRGSQRSLAL